MWIAKEATIFLMIFFAMSLFAFWLFNGGAYAKIIRYDLLLYVPSLSSRLEIATTLPVSSKPTNQTSQATTASDVYELIIPKIFVTAPIITPKHDTIPDILSSLESGVGLYPGSALPGDEGRSVILGHSSRASWYHGDYATVFALLEKLEVGDQFIIRKGSQQYTYQIFSKKFLLPSDVNAVLAGASESSEIDLLSCWPVGSASKRALIQAKLISHT